MTTASSQLDISELFHVETDGEFTVLSFKRQNEKVIIYDPGLYHTAICKSSLCAIDKQDGKLYYRGVRAEDKIQEGFLDAAGDILFGKDAEQKAKLKTAVAQHFRLIPAQKPLLDALPLSMHPMDFLAAAVLALSAAEEKELRNLADLTEKIGFIIAQVAITVSYYYVRLNNATWIEPRVRLDYPESILMQMHSGNNPERLKKLSRILNTIMILHAEHGLNCSAATVRNIASAKGSIYSAVASGMAAFNGTIHGGASQLVSKMYEELAAHKIDVNAYVDQKIEKKELLMGFGQRTYNRIKNCWDPRVETMYRILTSPSFDFPEVEPYRNVALKLIERVCGDPFFKQRNLTPNPDLFNCIFFKLFGAPKEMNTTMLALGRIVGWTAHFVEHSKHSYPLTRPCDLSL
jgi:citrate synthase